MLLGKSGSCKTSKNVTGKGGTVSALAGTELTLLRVMCLWEKSTGDQPGLPTATGRYSSSTESSFPLFLLRCLNTYSGAKSRA